MVDHSNPFRGKPDPTVQISGLNFQNALLQQFPARDGISYVSRAALARRRFQFVDKLRNDRECLLWFRVRYGQIDAVIESTPGGQCANGDECLVGVGGRGQARRDSRHLTHSSRTACFILKPLIQIDGFTDENRIDL